VTITINKPYDWMIDEHSRNKRDQTDAILRQLDFDVTHACNKNCINCNLQISKSKFGGLTIGDFRYIAGLIKNKDAIRGIKFTGGEPLVNPDFIRILILVNHIFPNASIMIHTNGKLLPLISPEIFNKFCWRISEYPGWIDEVIDQHKKFPNVYIYKWKGDFFDPTLNPKLSETQAKIARERCMFSVRIIGKNLYGCCLSYPIEIQGQCESVHVPLTENWQENSKQLETWKACRHCSTALRVIDETTT